MEKYEISTLKYTENKTNKQINRKKISNPKVQTKQNKINKSLEKERTGKKRNFFNFFPKVQTKQNKINK